MPFCGLLNRLSSPAVSSWNKYELATALLRTAEGSNRDILLPLTAADVPRLNKENTRNSNKNKWIQPGNEESKLGLSF
jgi:hypothetical protein